ncbi:MAG: sulfite exporter TauE/SafE family protein [Alphaproteobacteria bacterium]|nr:sulfite exporter TauE/SafE family protein [Alphaproteobacteria bacterium]MCB9930239.1 sulfite exporter TauE/SafE family protein [Alphaproteobacteria bacterium]
MTFAFVAYIVAGAFLGGFINGLAGFGTALFALGLLLQVLTPVQAVAICVVLSVVGGIPGLIVVRHHLEWRRLVRFLLPAFVGIPIGVALLAVVDARALKLITAAFLLFYGAYFVLRRDLPKVEGEFPLVDAAVGFAGGVLGGLASLSGVLPTVWASLRPWPKLRTRAVLQPFNVAILASTAVVLAAQGAYTRPVGLALLVAIPTTVVASQIGIRIFQRLSDARFRRLLIALIVVSGIGILVKELLLA